MNLSKWPIFKAGVFKQAKYLVSTPQKAESALEILETGVIGIEPLPMSTGFLRAPDPTVRKAWANVHSLKVQIYQDGVPTDEAAALPISERSYIPLDSLAMLKTKDKEKLASLDDIALSCHDDALANTTKDTGTQIQQIIIQYGFAFMFLLAAIFSIRGCS